MNNEKEQGVSTEAIGQLSPNQLRELNILGGVVFTELNLDRNNPEAIKALQEVLVDCVKRGLKLVGKVWFSPSESVISAYRAGLSEREKVAEQVKKMTNSLLIQSMTTEGEIALLRDIDAEHTLALSPKLEEAEDLINTLSRRNVDINNLHTELFNNSKLSESASTLKMEALEIAQREGTTQVWNISDRLFANFISHTALFRTPGLDIEPKDLVTLNKLWSNEQARQNSQTLVLNSVLELAKSLHLPENSIATYTTRMLDIVSNELLNISDLPLLTKSIFIYTEAQIKEEAAEFEVEPEKVITIESEQVEIARNKYSEYIKVLKDYLGPIYRQEDIPDDYGEDFVKYLKSINPLEYVFILKGSFEKGSFIFENMLTEPESDLEDLEIEVYIEALNLLKSPLVVEGTEEPILSFENPPIEDKMIRFTEELVFKQIFKPGARWNEILEKLPAENLITFLGSVDLNRLNKAQRESILNFDLDLWVKLLSETGVEYSTSLISSEGSLKLKAFSFSPDSTGLIPYLELLPEEKLTKIASKLRKEIKLD